MARMWEISANEYNQSKVYFKIVHYEIAVSSIFVMKVSIRYEPVLIRRKKGYLFSLAITFLSPLRVA